MDQPGCNRELECRRGLGSSEAEQPWSSEHHSVGTGEDQPAGALKMVKLGRFCSGRKGLEPFQSRRFILQLKTGISKCQLVKHSDVTDTDSCSRNSDRGSVLIISVAAGGVRTSTTTATISFSDSLFPSASTFPWKAAQEIIKKELPAFSPYPPKRV